MQFHEERILTSIRRQRLSQQKLSLKEMLILIIILKIILPSIM